MDDVELCVIERNKNALIEKMRESVRYSVDGERDICQRARGRRVGGWNAGRWIKDIGRCPHITLCMASDAYCAKYTPAKDYSLCKTMEEQLAYVDRNKTEKNNEDASCKSCVIRLVDECVGRPGTRRCNALAILDTVPCSTIILQIGDKSADESRC